MSKEIKTWFAAMAFTGLTFSLMHAGTVLAQPPGRGPGRPDGGRPDAGRPDAGRPDGGRPDGGRPDGSPSDRSQEDQSRSRGPRPPMEQLRGDAPRDEGRGPRDASSDHGRSVPPRVPSRPEGDRSGRPDDARRGPSSFAPDAFFDRLDKDGDGTLSRDEFKAVAAFHRGHLTPPGPQGFSGHRGPGAMAHHGPDMRGGGPPWAGSDRGPSFGPHQFPGSPPWSRSGHGPQLHGKFAGPPWAQHAQHDRDSHQGKEKKKGHDVKKGHDKKNSPGQKKGNDHGKKDQQDRSDSQKRDHHRSDAKAPHTSTGLAATETPHLATLPL